MKAFEPALDVLEGWRFSRKWAKAAVLPGLQTLQERLAALLPPMSGPCFLRDSTTCPSATHIPTLTSLHGPAYSERHYGLKGVAFSLLQCKSREQRATRWHRMWLLVDMIPA